MEFKLKLTGKRDEAKGSKTFLFEKPAGFSYKAGQFLYFILPKLAYSDERGNIRHFTLSSSPTEDYLSFTTRVRPDGSGYKKTLDELEIGIKVTGRGPNGVFVLDDENTTTSHVFLAGGIGITPFRSIIKYVSDKNLQVPIHLIYSNSTPEEIVFKNEIDQISSSHESIKVTYTITHPDESKIPWAGLTGRIDADMIRKLVTDNWQLTTVTYWLCGPPVMVDAMEQVIDQLHIPPENIKIEKFTGY